MKKNLRQLLSKTDSYQRDIVAKMKDNKYEETYHKCELFSTNGIIMSLETPILKEPSEKIR